MRPACGIDQKGARVTEEGDLAHPGPLDLAAQKAAAVLLDIRSACIVPLGSMVPAMAGVLDEAKDLTVPPIGEVREA